MSSAYEHAPVYPVSPGNAIKVRAKGVHRSDQAKPAAYLNGSSGVTMTVKDIKTGLELGGDTWPKTMAYEASTNGDYLGVVIADVTNNMTEGSHYIVEVAGDFGGTLESLMTLILKAVTRYE